MMLTVSMTVSHLYQNLKNIKSVRSLKEPSDHETVNFTSLMNFFKNSKKAIYNTANTKVKAGMEKPEDD